VVGGDREAIMRGSGRDNVSFSSILGRAVAVIQKKDKGEGGERREE